MSTSIAEYSPTEAALADLRQRYANVVFDVATTKGMEAARKGRAEIRGYRTALEAKRKEIKAPALERCRLIDEEAKRITGELVALEDPIDSLIKAEEQRKEAERAAKELAERQRVTKIHERIGSLAELVATKTGRSSAEIERTIETVESWTPDGWAAEFTEQAQAAKAAALAKLGELRAAAIEQEAEQARLKAEREELARLRAEQQQREREERERAEADRIKREAEEREARAKIEAEEREARERIAEQQRKADAERAEADRIAREKREAEEAEARRRQTEEDDRLRKERERIDAERREVEAKEREQRRQEAELMDGMQMLQTFVERYGSRAEFKLVAKGIVAFLNTHKQAA